MSSLVLLELQVQSCWSSLSSLLSLCWSSSSCWNVCCGAAAFGVVGVSVGKLICHSSPSQSAAVGLGLVCGIVSRRSSSDDVSSMGTCCPHTSAGGRLVGSLTSSSCSSSGLSVWSGTVLVGLLPLFFCACASCCAGVWCWLVGTWVGGALAGIAWLALGWWSVVPGGRGTGGCLTITCWSS